MDLPLHECEQIMHLALLVLPLLLRLKLLIPLYHFPLNSHSLSEPKQINARAKTAEDRRWGIIKPRPCHTLSRTVSLVQ